MLPVALFGICG